MALGIEDNLGAPTLLPLVDVVDGHLIGRGVPRTSWGKGIKVTHFALEFIVVLHRMSCPDLF